MCSFTIFCVTFQQTIPNEFTQGCRNYARNIRDFPGDDWVRNMTKEKSTTRQSLICADILPCMYSLPLPQSNNLARVRNPIENSVSGQRSASKKHTTSMKHSGQTSGMRKWIFLAAARQFPAQKFKGKHGKQPVSRKNLRKQIEKFIEICKRKRK